MGSFPRGYLCYFAALLNKRIASEELRNNKGDLLGMNPLAVFGITLLMQGSRTRGRLDPEQRPGTARQYCTPSRRQYRTTGRHEMNERQVQGADVDALGSGGMEPIT